jgi:hypothetical protein
VVHAELIELNGTYGRAFARPLDRTVRVGCSGWQYAHWRGDVYAAELPTSRWFAHYVLTSILSRSTTASTGFHRGDVCEMARAGAAAFSSCGEGEPIPDAHEEAEGRERNPKTCLIP